LALCVGLGDLFEQRGGRFGVGTEIGQAGRGVARELDIARPSAIGIS
jgi:hypothetical protein